jgi:hypothetical protein
LLDSTKRVNRTAIVVGHTVRARRKNKKTKKEIEEEIEEELEEKLEEDLGGPLLNQRLLTPRLLILVPSNILVLLVFQNSSPFFFLSLLFDFDILFP